jgi:hypothetical protein
MRPEPDLGDKLRRLILNLRQLNMVAWPAPITVRGPAFYALEDGDTNAVWM